VDTYLTSSPTEAAEFVRRGQLVAFPTETVYGLGADALQPAAVEAIFEAKGRPSDNPLIVHLAEREQLSQVVASVPVVASRLLSAFAPGPLTLILPKATSLPSVVTAGLDTVGVRFPRHETAKAFLRACDTPVAAPSANRSGRPSPTTWTAVAEDLDGRIDCILKGGRTDAGVESTVLDCTTSPPTVLRPGALPVERLEEVVGPVAMGAKDQAEDSPRSPGTKHRHYAPTAQVRLVDDPSEADPDPSTAYLGLTPPAMPSAFGECRVVPDVERYARDLFHFFRTCDQSGCAIIYAQRVPDDGLGRALNDRLRRAAAR
jgi:L-threonylcarbamoyladenylate synthase